MKKMTPLKSVRKYCVSCGGESKDNVRLCPVEKCALHPIKNGKNGGKVKSVVKSIRARCVDCAGGSRKSIEACELTECSLWPYRFGTNPARSGVGGAPA